MDAVVGLVVLVAIVWVVRAAMSGSGSAPRRGSHEPGRTPSTRPPVAPPADPVERRRQDRADEAFVDGVLFAHHFDPFGRHDGTTDDADGSAAYGAGDLDDDGWDDGWDEDDSWDEDEGWDEDGGWDEDDVFHDDAGDW